MMLEDLCACRSGNLARSEACDGALANTHLCYSQGLKFAFDGICGDIAFKSENAVFVFSLLFLGML